jgi:adenosylcobinamide kinase/adenosylcobinamide-phosphate guanylyltransferase
VHGPAQIILVGGGVRSGKSTFALLRARELGERRVLVATAQAHDDEMAARIAAHRRERGDAFVTVEEPYDLAGVLAAPPPADVLVVDCLTLWLSNHLCRDDDEARLRATIDALVASLAARRAPVVLVTNEVGMGVVPESALGRRFRDLAGLLHQRIATLADELYVGTMGCVLRLRPGPVEVAWPRPGGGEVGEVDEAGAVRSRPGRR